MELDTNNIKDLSDEKNTTTDDVLNGSFNHLHQKPKSGEFWGADMPFANISENRLAKTISMAVGCYHVDRSNI